MKKKTKNDVVILEKQVEITGATIKDDFCNYSYEVRSGVGVGDTHNVKGSGIIDDDLRDAFQKLNVHFACIDGVFKHNGIKIKNIDDLKVHELTMDYQVTGFVIKGNAESQSVILKGNKHIGCASDRGELTLPRIPLDSLSSYEWWNELLDAVTNARMEVELYKDGKNTPVEPEPKEDPNQLTIGDAIEDAEEFENAKV
jgi:hypothetical protein